MHTHTHTTQNNLKKRQTMNLKQNKQGGTWEGLDGGKGTEKWKY